MLLLRTLQRFSTATPKDTCLRNLHLQHQGKLVDFAGYNLPVQYTGKGIIKEHLHCRTNASLFDVSHMGQLLITGPDRVKLLQRTTVGNTTRPHKNGVNECYLTMFLNEKGGIIDDAIACNNEQTQTVRIVVNGANKYIDVAHLQQVIQTEKYNVKLEHLQDNGLVALQGPKSAQVLQALIPTVTLADIPFMAEFKAKFQGQEYTITRSGYTGEDGFQIGSTGPNTVAITEAILRNPLASLAGLGCRDSLRLEAGLCLHGHDISTSVTPFEASLMWTVHKRKAGDPRLKFIGEDALAKQQADVKSKAISIRKRVGFMLNDAGVVREHCKIFTKEGKEVGETTSGGPSPSLKKTIGMAYIDQNLATEGTELWAEQRGRHFSLSVKKMPFVPSNYYKRWGA